MDAVKFANLASIYRVERDPLVFQILMFLDKLLSNFIRLCQFLSHLNYNLQTRSTQLILCHSVPNVCVHSYITSKRIKIVCPTLS